MTKAELIDVVASDCEITKKVAAVAVDTVFESISNALSEGDSFTLIGFGTFSVSERAERKGRNPQTGEEITISAKKVVKFKPGKKLKEAVE